jgi:biotin transporter BioY
MTHATYADLLRPSTAARAALYDFALIIGGSLLIALGAQAAIPIGPVPITMQTFAVLFVGALLGSWRGALSVLAYLTEGVMGLPFFAGGAAGAAYLAGPTGGYLIGFVFAALAAGFLTERGWDRRVGTTVAAMILGSAVFYVFGLAGLALLPGWDSEKVLRFGLYPFIPGDLAKIALAAAILPAGWKMLGKRRE